MGTLREIGFGALDNDEKAICRAFDAGRLTIESREQWADEATSYQSEESA